MWIYEHFLMHAQQQPEHLAVVLNQECLTYGELAGRVECVAARLLRLVGGQARVALHLTKSIQAITMMLACVRAGITYVPIDPKCPIERRNQILRDCQANLLVLDRYTTADWEVHTFVTSSLAAIVSPETISRYAGRQFLWSELQEADEAPLPEWSALTADSLAYLLYTSGSTGTPKGVMITYGNANAFVEWGYQTFEIMADDHVAVHAPLHFDLPVFDVYVGLAKGATLYLIDESTVLFPEALYRFLRDLQISVLYAVPSALTALALRSSLRSHPLPHLHYLLYAGEEFQPESLRFLMSQLPAARVFNLYGPIETNVITQFEVTQEHLQWLRIPIGYPIFNTCLFLLGAEQQIVEEGEGEIVVSGPSVTPGYLNHPQQTQDARCTIPSKDRIWDCYRTGDFASRDADGLLHFLGRRDGMVKTRGFRVEMGDVEAAIARHPTVAEVVVIAAAHPIYTNLLYAFIVLHERKKVSEAELSQAVRKHVPAYMCPQQLFLRTELPKTSTGKIARLVLQEELKSMLAASRDLRCDGKDVT